MSELNSGLAAILAQQAVDVERFAKESKEIDSAFRNGKLSDWIKSRVDRETHEYNSTQDGDGSD